MAFHFLNKNRHYLNNFRLKIPIFKKNFAPAALIFALAQENLRKFLKKTKENQGKRRTKVLKIY